MEVSKIKGAKNNTNVCNPVPNPIDDATPNWLEFNPPEQWNSAKGMSDVHGWNPIESTYHSSSVNGSTFFVQFQGERFHRF